eukprot:m.15443 g.15443  ORF g.15443 m.15443 type:complete len:349 (-) comp4478_c1_seq1:97-1143(-)
MVMVHLSLVRHSFVLFLVILTALVCCCCDGVFGKDCSVRSFQDAANALQRNKCRELKVKNSQELPSSDDVGFLSFLDALRIDTNVRELELIDNHLGDEGVIAIMNALLKRNADMYSLEIEKNQLTDDGIVELSLFLSKSSALRAISLADNNLTDRGITVIASALPKLTHEVDFSRNHVGDVGFISLLHAAAQTMLREIELDHNDVSNDGAIFAADFLLEEKDHLREIDLKDNRIVHEGVSALEEVVIKREKLGKPIKLKLVPTIYEKKSSQKLKSLDWNEDAVSLWVKSISPSFSQYGTLFQENAINGQVLTTLTDEDLRVLIRIDNPMHRRRILAEIQVILSHDELR